MSTPERALDTVLHGRLHSLHANYEKEHHSILHVAQGGLLACPLVYVVNFHQEDLPFSYRSVDRYARTIVRVAASGNLDTSAEVRSVATAIHGPGAGLDACESMETLIVGFASELRTTSLGTLAEIILVESNRDIFERLQERLKYLASKDILRFERGDTL